MTGSIDPSGGPPERPQPPSRDPSARRHGLTGGRPDVVTPDGTTWVVRRRWVPRLGNETVWGRFRRRIRKTTRRAGDGLDGGCIGDVGDGIIALIVAAIFLVVLVFVLIPLLVALLDLLLVALLAIIGVVARSLFGHPWVVEAVDDRGTALRWRVQGWGASRRRCVEVVQHLQAGIVPPDAERVDAPTRPDD